MLLIKVLLALFQFSFFGIVLSDFLDFRQVFHSFILFACPQFGFW
jgi:hypothetical protein